MLCCRFVLIIASCCSRCKGLCTAVRKRGFKCVLKHNLERGVQANSSYTASVTYQERSIRCVQAEVPVALRCYISPTQHPWAVAFHFDACRFRHRTYL